MQLTRYQYEVLIAIRALEPIGWAAEVHRHMKSCRASRSARSVLYRALQPLRDLKLVKTKKGHARQLPLLLTAKGRRELEKWLQMLCRLAEPVVTITK